MRCWCGTKNKLHACEDNSRTFLIDSTGSGSRSTSTNTQSRCTHSPQIEEDFTLKRLYLGKLAPAFRLIRHSPTSRGSCVSHRRIILSNTTSVMRVQTPHGDSPVLLQGAIRESLKRKDGVNHQAAAWTSRHLAKGLQLGGKGRESAPCCRRKKCGLCTRHPHSARRRGDASSSDGVSANVRDQPQGGKLVAGVLTNFEISSNIV